MFGSLSAQTARNGTCSSRKHVVPCLRLERRQMLGSNDEGTVSAWHRYEFPNAVINVYYRVVGRPFSRSREVDLACASNVACTVSAIF
jgi:hypothetical protein